MQAAQRLDENPCRPRHFKPPLPCAPIVADESANQVLETCRTRLVAAAALFAVVFLVVVLRLAEVALLIAGSAESHVGRLPPAAPPPPARADIVDRNGALLATMLPKPSLFVNSKALLAAGQNPDEAAYELASVLPDKSPGEIRARLVAGKRCASCAEGSSTLCRTSARKAPPGSSWMCGPAKSLRWSRSRISTPTNRAIPMPANRRPTPRSGSSTRSRSAITRWARSSRSLTPRWRSIPVLPR